VDLVIEEGIFVHQANDEAQFFASVSGEVTLWNRHLQLAVRCPLDLLCCLDIVAVDFDDEIRLTRIVARRISLLESGVCADLKHEIA